MKYFLLSGVEAESGDRFHAIQIREDGHYKCYKEHDSDVDALVKALSDAGFESNQLLSATYWRDESHCRLVDIATCEGDCPLGEGCKLETSRGFYYCKCVARKPPEAGD